MLGCKAHVWAVCQCFAGLGILSYALSTAWLYMQGTVASKQTMTLFCKFEMIFFLFLWISEDGDGSWAVFMHSEQQWSHVLFLTLVGHRTAYLQFILCCNTSVGGLEGLFEVFIFTFFWYAHSHLCAFRFVEELKASKFLPMFLTPSSNEMKYSTYGQELSRCLSRGLWNAFGIMFMMPKTRAGFSLAELPIASVTAALVFWVNHQTYPYLYPSNTSDCLRHSCVHSGEHA